MTILELICAKFKRGRPLPCPILARPLFPSILPSLRPMDEEGKQQNWPQHIGQLSRDKAALSPPLRSFNCVWHQSGTNIMHSLQGPSTPSNIPSWVIKTDYGIDKSAVTILHRFVDLIIYAFFSRILVRSLIVF